MTVTTVHVRSLEKYLPAYSDRSLAWFKVYFRNTWTEGEKFANFFDDEQVEQLCEIDRYRFLSLIGMEALLGRPVPLDTKRLSMMGWDVRKRPISLTLQMLQDFVDVCTDSVTQNKSKSKKKSKEEERENCAVDVVTNVEQGVEQQGKTGGLRVEQGVEQVHPLQLTIAEKYPRVAKMAEPLTFSQASKLVSEFPASVLLDVLDGMENFAKLLTKYRSAYLTTRNWAKMRMEKRNGSVAAPTVDVRPPQKRTPCPECGELLTEQGHIHHWQPGVCPKFTIADPEIVRKTMEQVNRLTRDVDATNPITRRRES